MIYIKSSIEPDREEEFDIVSISLMRRTNEINTEGEYKYTYGGWWNNRDGSKNYTSGFIYNKRENSIFTLISKICMDIENKKGEAHE